MKKVKSSSKRATMLTDDGSVLDERGSKEEERKNESDDGNERNGFYGDSA